MANNYIFLNFNIRWFAQSVSESIHLMSFLIPTARLHIQYPMLFKLTNKKKNRETHCGVLEFVADEGRIYIPYWVCII